MSILTFLLLDIRSGSRLVLLVASCSLIRPSLACPANQWGKPLIYLPAPRCCNRWPPGQQRRRLRPASCSSGTGSRCLQRRRRISAGQQRRRLLPARCSSGTGSRRLQRQRRISAGQQRRRLRPARRTVAAVAPSAAGSRRVLCRRRISAASAGTGRGAREGGGWDGRGRRSGEGWGDGRVGGEATAEARSQQVQDHSQVQDRHTSYQLRQPMHGACKTTKRATC
jgi:hypothetical protein